MTRPRLVLAVVLLAVAGRPAAAIDYSWNGTSISNTATTANWTSGSNFTIPAVTNRPTTVDRVSFDSTSTGLLNTLLDDSFSFLKLTVANNVTAAADPILIGPGAPTTNTLTVLGEGLDLSAANKSLTITSRFVVGADQPWAVNGSRTLTLSGVVSSPAVQVLAVNGAAGNTGTVVLSGSNTFAATSSLTLRAGSLRADNAAALTGLTGSGGTSGITLDPLSTATLGLNAAGTYSNSLKLVGTSPSVQSVVNGLAAGTTTLSGPVTVAGSGLVALNVAGGGTLDLTSTVGGAFTGTLQVGGATGAGRLGGAVGLSAGAGLVKTGGSTWTLGAANTWTTTAVRAGVLRSTVPAALPGTATLTLGTAGSAAVGTLDLFGISQSVGGLDTFSSSDAFVNPADNRIGIGDVSGPGAFASTLTYAGGTSVFAGTVVDSVFASGGGVTKAVSLTVSSGSLTLQSANTHSGATVVTGSGTVLALGSVSGGAGGGFTNFGSFASSPTVTVRSGAGLNVAGATGGLNSLGGQFAPVANQTLRGEGAVTGAVTIPAAATLRGGEPGVSPNGQLSVAGPVTIQGGPVGSGGGQLAVDLNGTSTSGTLVGRVAVTGGNPLNLAVSPGNPVTIRLIGSQNLIYGTPYTFDVATAGDFRRNGTPGVTSYTFGPAGDFVLSADSVPLNAYIGTPTLTASSGTLTLGFTPVPEPATVLAVAVVGLGAARLRRRILAG